MSSVEQNIGNDEQCASVSGHFDGRPEELKRCMRHRPMQHVHGYIGSHWTLPSGNYLLRISPAAAMVTIDKTSMQNVPSLLAISMTIAMRRYYRPLCPMEEVCGFHISH
jgi:hypothetical protein